jgi:hypothetical protein
VKQSAAILFPHIVQLESIFPKDAKSPEIVHFERVWAQYSRTLQFRTEEGETWHNGHYYYLRPNLNFYPLDRLQRDPNEDFQPAVAQLYGEPNPNPVVLVVEGKSDESFFRRLLDRLYPKWKVLNIKVLEVKGAGNFLQFIFGGNKIVHQTEFFIVYDEDARNKLSKAGWDEIKEIVTKSPKFAMIPDIEGVSPTALLSAISKCWPTVVFEEAVILPKLLGYLKDVKYDLNRHKETGGTLRAARNLIGQINQSQLQKINFGKSEKWGECLADAMLDEGDLPQEIRSVIEQLLISARGLIITPE